MRWVLEVVECTSLHDLVTLTRKIARAYARAVLRKRQISPPLDSSDCTESCVELAGGIGRKRSCP